MDAVKVGCRLLRLVGLQVADEMPPDPDVGCLADFLQAFLDLVFAKVVLSGRPGGSYVTGTEGLGDGNEADGLRVPADAARGRVEPGSDGLKIRDDAGVHVGRRCYLM